MATDGKESKAAKEAKEAKQNVNVGENVNIYGGVPTVSDAWRFLGQALCMASFHII